MKHLWPFAACVLACTGASAQQVEKHDMELVGSHDLQGRSAYQPLVHRQGDRWIAYVGHHGGRSRNPLSGTEEPNGTSILDVSDPKNPRYIAHIPGEAGEGTRGTERAEMRVRLDRARAIDQRERLLRGGNRRHARRRLRPLLPRA